MIATVVRTALSVQTTFAMSVSVMHQTTNEDIAWRQFRRTPGMKQLWTHCDMFAAFGVGLSVGFLMGLTIALIVIK